MPSNHTYHPNRGCRTSTTKTNETDEEISGEKDTISSVEAVDISKESDKREESTPQQRQSGKNQKPNCYGII
ncbi:8576_t:CDS:2 [Paraglomus occultum]|uniref:8576_t:CDS:1 n=1 Tax=Paraglomus occultum TaxID=144539 RepID=A0A9N9FD46_9GLOM|nr:8576_t:CDS:2 [Paraglomus occultum]